MESHREVRLAEDIVILSIGLLGQFMDGRGGSGPGGGSGPPGV